MIYLIKTAIETIPDLPIIETEINILDKIHRIIMVWGITFLICFIIIIIILSIIIKKVNNINENEKTNYDD